MMNFRCVYFCVIICYCRSVVLGMFKKTILCGLRGRLFDVSVVKRLGNKRKCVCCFYYGIVDWFLVSVWWSRIYWCGWYFGVFCLFLCIVLWLGGSYLFGVYWELCKICGIGLWFVLFGVWCFNYRLSWVGMFWSFVSRFVFRVC